MRAAAILGIGASTTDLAPFQKGSDADWQLGLPASSSEADAVLVFGGDGTIHRHLSDLVKLGLPVLVVPRGSGNDFARALSLKRVRDSIAAWRRFRSHGDNVRSIDLGVISPCASHEARGKGFYFCTVGGVGLDAEVARRANRYPRWFRGNGGYALTLPYALARFDSVRTRVLMADAGESEFKGYADKPLFLAAFGNSTTYGGGMKIAPQAQMDDGELDVCLITDIDKLKLFCLFPTVYFGRHLGIPQVDYQKTERVRIEPERPLEVYADGEFVCQTPIEVSVARLALKVITAAPR